MKAKGFDGREREWNLSKKTTKKKLRRCSNLHRRARLVLRKLFPSSTILEEVHLPGSNTVTRSSTLFADFYLPRQRLLIEVHGEQHYKFNEFFHRTKSGFLKSKSRDRDKIRWCELNEIDVVVLKYTGSDDEWREQILKR